MADLDDITAGKDFGLDKPADNQGFFLKGAANYDWGIKNRLSRIFNPKTGRTVMLAFDHGYFQGPATGLERIDLNILPLAEYADVLMCTRGALRSIIPPTVNKPVVLRCSGGNSILTELSNETVAVDIDDAIRIDAAAMAAQIYIGAEYEHQSIANVIKLIDTGMRYSIPTLAVTGVGKEHGARRPVLRPVDAHRRRDRRALRQELLCRAGFRADHRRLSGADRHRRRQEAAGARGAGDGLQGHRPGCGRRRHGA